MIAFMFGASVGNYWGDSGSTSIKPGAVRVPWWKFGTDPVQDRRGLCCDLKAGTELA